MKKITIYICSILLIFTFHSCEPNELDEPTEVSMTVSVIGRGFINSGEDDEDDEEDEDENGNEATGDKKAGLSIDGGSLYVSEIEFDGIRENTEDYYFSKTFDEPLHADLYSDNLDRNVTFSVPQGSYSKVEMTIYFTKSDTLPAFLLTGEFQLGNAERKDVEIEFDEAEFELTLYNIEDEKQILFTKSESRNINIQLNLNKLLSPLNTGELLQAESFQSGQKEKIIISAQHNDNLYYNLETRIERSFRAIIK